MNKEEVAKLHITRVAVNDALIGGTMTLDQAKPYITEVAIASAQSTDPVEPVGLLDLGEEQPIVDEEPADPVEDPGIEIDETEVV